MMALDCRTDSFRVQSLLRSPVDGGNTIERSSESDTLENFLRKSLVKKNLLPRLEKKKSFPPV